MLFGIAEHFHFILASRSPRRQQLLRDAGMKFDVAVRDYDESFPSQLKGAAIAEYLSASKASAFGRETMGQNDVVITADTVVWCNDQALEKPKDFTDALKIIRLLSDNTHEVITGVTFRSKSGDHTFSETTYVTFDHLSDPEIEYYISKFNPFDKAGAYGIQEWIGITGISRIEGSYFNVMGLPVNRLLKELRKYLSK